MSTVLATVLAGLAQGVPFFLAAAGLSLILGVMGVLNFAQGGLFMLGAYVVQSVLGGSSPSVLVFILALLVATAAAALLGALSERTLFVTTYSAGPHALIGILVSFGLLLAITGVVPYIWGNASLTQLAPAALSGRVAILGAVVSKYSLFLLACGVVIVFLMYLLLQRSDFGKTMVAVASDRAMASALGVRTWSVSAWVFAIAGGLAGIGGGLIAPLGSINSGVGQSYLILAFVAMVIGGLGSMTGTFVGAMIIGIVDSAFVNYLPDLQPFAAYLAAAAVLLVRPRGIFGASAMRTA